MYDERIKLMTQLIIGLYEAIDFRLPYYAVGGVNLGQCRYCKCIGVVHYPDIMYTHAPDCLMRKLDQLRRIYEHEEEMQ